MSACVLDADVVIAVLDRRDRSHGAAIRALRKLTDEGTELLLSLVNYTEALVQPAAEPEALQRATRSLRALGFSLVAPTAAIATDAAGLRLAGVSLGDAFALATARGRRATIASFDRGVHKAAQAAGIPLAPGLR